MPMVSMRNYVAIGPRGNSNYPGKRGKFRWCHTLDSLAAAEQNVFTAIDVAKSRYHISPHRVFLGGYQCGGTAALRIALSYPQRFAGAITIGGSFPSELTPLAQLNSARKMPLLVAHGRDAQYYSVDSLCDDLRLCHSAGLSISVRQYPTGDDLTTQMLHDINVWMMEIVTGIPAGPPHPPVSPIDAN
jgi:phospholipase/carboxylesterase